MELETALRSIRSMKASRSCSECEHWSREGCKMAGVMPPPDVQASGCELFLLDDFPF